MPDHGHRRREARHIAPLGTARLAYEQAGLPELQTGKVLNISDHGAMIVTRQEIPEHAVLMMKISLGEDAFLLVGRVMHSTQTVGGYKIGIKLDFPAEPSTESTPATTQKSPPESS